MSTDGAPGSPSLAGSSNRRYSLPTPPEQDHFEELCRSRFYRQDSDAIRTIERILREAASVPTALGCYSRILAGVRVKYHEDVARERQEELDRLMQVHGHPDMTVPREERKAKLQSFLDTHVSKEMIGTHPFAKALWTVLNLQATRSARGGGGEWCLEWTIADEVFMEAGPREWTRDSVALIKTVLGFTDVTASANGQSSAPSETEARSSESASVSQAKVGAGAASPPFADSSHATNPRASFTSTLPTSTTPARIKLSTLGASNSDSLTIAPSSSAAGVLQEGNKRTFRMPDYLSNPELSELASIFPAWIATAQARSLHFPSYAETFQPIHPGSAASAEALEEGRNEEYTKEMISNELKLATGTLRISRELRAAGWEGSIVERVKVWLKRLLFSPC